MDFIGHRQSVMARAGGNAASDGMQRQFIRWAALVGVVLLFWLSFVSYRSLQDFIEATDQYSQLNRLWRSSQQLLYLLREAESSQQAFLIFGEERYLNPYYEARRAMPVIVDELLAEPALPGREFKRFEALRALIGEWLELQASQIENHRSRPQAPLAEQTADQRKEQVSHDQIRALTLEIQTMADRMLTGERQLALLNRQRSLYAFVFADLLALGVIAALLIWHEWSLRQRDRQALRESEERFSQVATMTDEWLWEQDVQGRFLYSNEAVKKLLGYEPQEILGKSYFDLFTRTAREQALKFIYNTDAKLRFTRLINHYQHKDGREIITESTGIPIFGQQGQIIKWRGVDVAVIEPQSY